MAQNLSIDDICREIEAVFAMEEAQGHDTDLTCQSHIGLTRCHRHHLHHGRHASAERWQRNPERGGFYFPTKTVMWK